MQRFAADAGLAFDLTCVAQLSPAIEPTSNFDEGFSLTQSMVERGADFTALLAFDDLTGLGAIRALRQAGRRVPEDCSVVGFDDVPHAAMNTPGLTTIRQPMEEMGSLTAHWVLDSLAQSRGEVSISESVEPLALPGTLRLLPPELIVRDSTAPLRQ